MVYIRGIQSFSYHGALVVSIYLIGSQMINNENANTHACKSLSNACYTSIY